jgi:hypothetical protein
MKAVVTIGLVLLGYLALAAVQDGPLQVWLLAFAPFALMAIALVLHISDYSKSD